MSLTVPPPTPSLWVATAVPPAPTFALKGEIPADVAVIGAGYAGLSAALHLAEAGKSVVVLEAFEIGHGGAGRNNGMVIPSLTRAYPEDLRKRFGIERGNRFARHVAGAASFTFDLIRRLQIDCDAVQNGWAQPAHSPGRADLVRERFRQWQELGADVAYLDRAQITARTGSPLYHGAWLAHSGGHLNPLRYVRGLAAAAIKAGARIHTRSPAISVVSDGDGWKVATEHGRVRAGRVIVATDAYADQLFPRLRRSVVPVHSFQLATNPLPPELLAQILPGKLAISDTHADMHFARPTVDGRLVTGGALVLRHNLEPRLDRHVSRRLRKMFPAIGDETRFDYSWNGQVAITLDFLPHLHELAPGILSVAGYNGRGVALATTTGRLLAEALIDGRTSDDLDIPLTALRPVPLHGVVKRVASLELVRYRWRDRREVRV